MSERSFNHFEKGVPTYDFLGEYNLNSEWDLGECLDDLIYRIENGYFLQWEAVVRKEEGLKLSQAQEKALEQLISFSEDEDEAILYIDEMPRPNTPWYEIARKIVPKLILSPFRTYEIYDEIYHFGWTRLEECLEEYGQNLSLPKNISSAIEVFPSDTLHRLWLQCYCFDELSGLGQSEDLTLEEEEQKTTRIEGFIDALKECKDSIEYFDLSLETLLDLVKLPAKDEQILIESILHELKMKSPSQKLIEVL